MRTILVISPYFAPQSTVAVYRWVKLARHLPRLGFRPVVLSATFPDDPRDDSLLRALPPEVEVLDEYLDPALLRIRAASLSIRERAASKAGAPAKPLEGLTPFKSIVDRLLVHVLHASRAAERVARSRGASAVIVSAGPFSALPVGVHVKRALGTPLVFDFRDPWGLHETGRGAPAGAGERARRALVSALERRLLAQADHVVLNTRRAHAAYVEEYPEIVGKASFIRNHFDMGLYADPGPPPAPPARFTVVHVGTLRVETTVDDIGAALRILIDREGLTPSDLVFRQIGRMTKYEIGRVEAMGLSPYFEALPAVPQRDVLRELRRAHVLLSMVHERVDLRIAAKTYDYAASGMPIISITSNPEVDELLLGRPDNTRISPGNIGALVEALGARISAWRSSRALPTPAPPPMSLSSEAAASAMASILERVIVK